MVGSFIIADTRIINAPTSFINAPTPSINAHASFINAPTPNITMVGSFINAVARIINQHIHYFVYRKLFTFVEVC